LGTVLFVLLAAAVFFNLPKSAGGHDHGKTAEDALPTGESRPTPSKEELASKAKAQASLDDEAAPPPLGMQASGNVKTASIYLPKRSTHKPQPNDATIQGQWYRPDARKPKSPN
jgi:hypothetical protein